MWVRARATVRKKRIKVSFFLFLTRRHTVAVGNTLQVITWSEQTTPRTTFFIHIKQTCQVQESSHRPDACSWSTAGSVPVFSVPFTCSGCYRERESLGSWCFLKLLMLHRKKTGAGSSIMIWCPHAHKDIIDSLNGAEVQFGLFCGFAWIMTEDRATDVTFIWMSFILSSRSRNGGNRFPQTDSLFVKSHEYLSTSTVQDLYNSCFCWRKRYLRKAALLLVGIFFLGHGV